MSKLPSRLRKNENNISFSNISTKISGKYLEMLWIKFIQRNRHRL